MYETQIEKIIDAQLEFESINNQLAIYLFKWNKIPGKHDEKLIKFLKKDYNIDWIIKENIKKPNDKTIKVSTGKNPLSLKLNDEETKVKLEIDSRTAEFVAVKEGDDIRIYKATSHIFSDKASSKLIKLTRQIENNLNKKIIGEYKEKKPHTDPISLADFPILSSFIYNEFDEFDNDFSEPFHECVESIYDEILNIYKR